MHPAPRPVAAISFADAQGQARSLADFSGKVVVLNIWATWCVPCRKEMPALDRLQATLGGSDFEVVPVSVDRGGIDAVNKFYAETGLSYLEKYIDSSGQLLRSLGAVGLPTTLIIDRSGNEAGRVVGPAEWDTPEVVELLKSLVAKPDKPNKRASHDETNEGGSNGPIQNHRRQ
jgi:thiol-disulfide isomerase/thioredoxin